MKLRFDYAGVKVSESRMRFLELVGGAWRAFDSRGLPTDAGQNAGIVEDRHTGHLLILWDISSGVFAEADDGGSVRSVGIRRALFENQHLRGREFFVVAKAQPDFPLFLTERNDAIVLGGLLPELLRLSLIHGGFPLYRLRRDEQYRCSPRPRMIAGSYPAAVDHNARSEVYP